MLTPLTKTLAQIDIGGQYDAPFLERNPHTGLLGVGKLVSVILSNAYIIAGVLLLILLLVGGFKMIRSAGSKDAQEVASARSTLTYAIIGFLLIFVSYWIIQVIEAVTGLTIL